MLNRGCIPSKALIAAAHQFESAKHADAFGISVENVTVDFAKTQEFKTALSKMTGGVASLLKGNKVGVFNGECMFINETKRVYSMIMNHRVTASRTASLLQVPVNRTEAIPVWRTHPVFYRSIEPA